MDTKYGLMASKIKDAVSATMPGSTQHMFTEANAVADVNRDNDRNHYTSVIVDKFKKDGLNLDEAYAASMLDDTYYFCALRNIMSDKDISLLDMSFILNAEPNLAGQNLAMTSCLSDEFKAKIDGFFDISTDDMCDTLKRYSDCNFDDVELCKNDKTFMDGMISKGIDLFDENLSYDKVVNKMYGGMLDGTNDEKAQICAKAIEEVTGFDSKSAYYCALNAMAVEAGLAQPWFNPKVMEVFKQTLDYASKMQGQAVQTELPDAHGGHNFGPNYTPISSASAQAPTMTAPKTSFTHSYAAEQAAHEAAEYQNWLNSKKEAAELAKTPSAETVKAVESANEIISSYAKSRAEQIADELKIAGVESVASGPSVDD